MPVFQVHVPEDRFSPVQNRKLAAPLPRALNTALGIPAEDQLAAITSHHPDELNLGPGCVRMNRSDDAVISTLPKKKFLLLQRRAAARAKQLSRAPNAGWAPNAIGLLVKCQS